MSFEISGNGETLTIENCGKSYFITGVKSLNGDYSGFYLPANGDMIFEFLSGVKKSRLFYTYSENISSKLLQNFIHININSSKNKSPDLYFSKSPSNPQNLVFAFSGGTAFSKVKENFLYECADDFSQFLSPDPNLWADGSLFPLLENPVEITFESEKTKVTLNDSSINFSSFVSALLKLRHGKIFAPPLKLPPEPDFSIRIQAGDGRWGIFNFYKFSLSGGDESYAVLPKYFPSEFDDGQSREALQKVSGQYELSVWSAQKIISLFETR